MKQVKIRDLRGANLADLVRNGELVGITNSRILVGVLIPPNQNWIRHLMSENHARIQQSIDEGEQAVGASGLRALRSLVDAQRQGGQNAADEGEASGSVLDRSNSYWPLPGGDFVSVRLLGEFVDLVRRSLGPLGGGLGAGVEDAGVPPEPADSRTVRVGDFSGRVLEDAAAEGSVLILTHDRLLVGIVVPVTPRLVEHVIENNLSRVLLNISRGERQLREREDLHSAQGATGLSPEVMKTQV